MINLYIPERVCSHFTNDIVFPDHCFDMGYQLLSPLEQEAKHGHH